MKRIIGLLTVMLFLCSVTGCKKTTNNKDTKKQVDTKKVVNCTGNTEEEGFTIKEILSTEFVNNEASKSTLSRIYKVVSEEQSAIEDFNNMNFEQQITDLFNSIGVDPEQFSIKSEKISDNSYEIAVSGKYDDMMTIFTTEEETDLLKKKDYDFVYNKVLKPIAEDGKLKCVTKEA